MLAMSVAHVVYLYLLAVMAIFLLLIATRYIVKWPLTDANSTWKYNLNWPRLIVECVKLFSETSNERSRRRLMENVGSAFGKIGEI